MHGETSDPAELLWAAAEDAAHAPSMYNTQPWRLRLAGTNAVRLGWDPARQLPVRDPHGTYLLAALGAAAECIALGAAARGASAEVSFDPYPAAHEVATVTYGPALDLPDELAGHLAARRTSRKPFRTDPVPSAVLDRMAFDAEWYGASFSALTARAALRRASLLLETAATRDLETPGRYEERYRWLRPARSGSEAQDGMPLNAPLWRALGSATPWLLHPDRAQLAVGSGLHRLAGIRAAHLVRRSGAFCLLTMKEGTAEDWFLGGRALQRVWLTAAAAGLQVHPMTAVLDVAETRSQLAEAFDVGSTGTMIVGFRLGYGPVPAQPLRLPTPALLTALEPEEPRPPRRRASDRRPSVEGFFAS